VTDFAAPPIRCVHVTTGAAWDERRNTSRVIPPPPGAHREALACCAALRRTHPALWQWIVDGHPTLTEAEHFARFGKQYKRGEM
jgi:hypothetical protein